METSLSDRITALVEHFHGARGMAAFGRSVGVATATVQRWTRGATPDADHIRSIVTQTQCDPRWLLTGEGEAFPERVKERAEAYQGEEPQMSVAEELERVAARVRAAEARGESVEHVWRFAREGEPVGDDEEYRCIACTREGAEDGAVVVRRGVLPEGHTLSAMRVPDDSMEPTILRGSIAVIDHDDRSPEIAAAKWKGRRIIAARLDPEVAESVAIRYVEQVGDVLMLDPANPAHGRLVVAPEAIVGRVVFVAMDLFSQEG